MRSKHQKHSLKAKTSDAFETDVVRSDSVSGTISASRHEIRNTKYAKLTNSRKLDEERINQEWALS